MSTNRIVTFVGAFVAVAAVVLLALLGDYPADSAINVILGVLGGAGIFGAAAGPALNPPKPPTDNGGFVLIDLVVLGLCVAGILVAVSLMAGCAHNFTASAGGVSITRTPDCAASVLVSGDGDPEILRACIGELDGPVSIDPAVLVPTCRALRDAGGL
jgi:hypothetical protein